MSETAIVLALLPTGKTLSLKKVYSFPLRDARGVDECVEWCGGSDVVAFVWCRPVFTPATTTNQSYPHVNLGGNVMEWMVMLTGDSSERTDKETSTHKKRAGR